MTDYNPVVEKALEWRRLIYSLQQIEQAMRQTLAELNALLDAELFFRGYENELPSNDAFIDILADELERLSPVEACE